MTVGSHESLGMACSREVAIGDDYLVAVAHTQQDSHQLWREIGWNAFEHSFRVRSVEMMRIKGK